MICEIDDWMDRNWNRDLEVRAGEIAEEFGLDSGDVTLFCWLNSKTPDQAKRFFSLGFGWNEGKTMDDSEWIAACDWMDRNWNRELQIRTWEIAKEVGLDQRDVKLFCWFMSKTPDEAERYFRRGRINWDKASRESSR